MQHTSTTYQDVLRLSEMVVHGRIFQKADLIGTISINNSPYFTVYRRYNNVHEMVMVDYNGDIYLQKDLQFRESIRRVLCLSEMQMMSLHIESAFSFKHQAPPPTMMNRIPDMSWGEIQEMWFGIAVNVEGLFTTDMNDISQNEPSFPPPHEPREPYEEESLPEVSSTPYPSPSMGPLNDEVSHSPCNSDEELIRLLIELQASQQNPAILPENPIELGQPAFENDSAHRHPSFKSSSQSSLQKRTWMVKRETEPPSPPSRSPPASPSLKPTSHLMILRNGRELRRKIS